MPPPFPYTPPAPCRPDLVHQNDHFLVVNKPAGLLSVPGRGDDKADCLAARVQAEYPEALIVHRLDMETSGLLVLALGAEAHRRLSRFFRERRVEKRYVAVVAGQVGEERGAIDLPLLVDWPNRPRQKVDPIQGKPSLTRFRRLTYHPEKDLSRVELEPVTGRSHQLRVHMQALGHPILGDRLYAPESIQGLANRLLLHATHLAFPHPFSETMVEFTCPPPF